MYKRFPSHQYKKGFTLIEAVVYLALFGILMGGAIVAAYNAFEGMSRGQAHAMLEEEGNFLMGKINWALAGAQSVNAPTSGTVGSLLSVNKVTGISQNGTPLTQAGLIGLTGTSAFIDEGADHRGLNNADVQVSRLSFLYIVSSGNGVDPSRVEASTTLTARLPNGMLVSEDFTTINYLRH